MCNFEATIQLSDMKERVSLEQITPKEDYLQYGVPGKVESSQDSWKVTLFVEKKRAITKKIYDYEKRFKEFDNAVEGALWHDIYDVPNYPTDTCERVVENVEQIEIDIDGKDIAHSVKNAFEHAIKLCRNKTTKDDDMFK
jgi:hypothetical protein